MRGFGFLVALAVLFLNNNTASGKETPEPIQCNTSRECGWGALPCDKKLHVCILPPGKRWADPFSLAPASVEGLRARWKGLSGQIPKPEDECIEVDPTPGITGSTDPLPGEIQNNLDRIRASMLLPKNGTNTAWARTTSTPTSRYATGYCLPASKGIADLPPVKHVMMAITVAPEHIKYDNEGDAMKSNDSKVALVAEGGVAGHGERLLYTTALGLDFEQKAFVVDAMFTVMFNPSHKDDKVGWDVSLRPGFRPTDSVAITFPLGGGMIGKGITAPTFEAPLHVGARVEFAPLVLSKTSSWAKILTVYAEADLAKVFREDDSFSSADWRFQWMVGLKLPWELATF